MASHTYVIEEPPLFAAGSGEALLTAWAFGETEVAAEGAITTEDVGAAAKSLILAHTVLNFSGLVANFKDGSMSLAFCSSVWASL